MDTTNIRFRRARGYARLKQYENARQEMMLVFEMHGAGDAAVHQDMYASLN